MSNYNELRSKWEKIVKALPVGQAFEFDVPEIEADILVDILREMNDTIYIREELSRKTSYIN